MDQSNQQGEGGVPGWVVGTICTFLSAIFTSLGNVFMKKAQNLEDAKIERGEKSIRFSSIPIANPWWWAGLLSQSVLGIISLTAAGQSIIYPLGGGLTIVFSQILTPYFVSGEKLTRLDWVSTCTIIVGMVITVAFGTHEDTDFTVDQLLGFFSDGLFIFVLILTMSINLTIMFFWRTRRQYMLDKLPRVSLVALGFSASVWAALQGIILKNTGTLIALAASGGNSTASGNTTMSGNSTSEFENPFSRFEAWVFVIMIPFIAVIQVIYLNHGLQNFPAVKYIPVYNTQIVIIPSIVGAVYFQEYLAFHPVAFPIGIIIVASGILILSYKTEHVPTPHAGAEAPGGIGENGGTEMTGKVADADSQIREI